MSALIVQPFQDGLPFGAEYKYEDVYVAVETEIDKNTSVSSGSGTDWQIVVKSSEAILAEHSKDLKLASWWLFGLWKLEGLQGLERGLPLFSELLQTFTTSLYPKSIKVKKRTTSWLETSLSDAVMADETSFADLQNPQELLEKFLSVETGLQAACEDDERFCRKVQQRLERLVAEKKADERKKETPVEVQREKPAVKSPSAPAQPTTVSSENALNKVVQSIKKSADLAADYSRQNDFGSLLALRLNRLQSWLEVDELPMNEAGKTMMNPPSESSVESIEGLIAEEAYPEALSQLEKILKFSSFWFDGHYMAYKLLKSAGEERAAEEVKQAVLYFSGLYPESVGFTFNEGTVFASKKTKEWLAVSKGVTQHEVTSEESPQEKRNIVLNQAKAMVNKNNIKEAMGLLQSHYTQATNNVEKFQWRFAHAEIAIECGKKEIALALLEDLEKQIDQHHLDEWQPELASQVYVLFLASYTRAQVALEKLDAVYSRLCKIDSTLAVEINY